MTSRICRQFLICSMIISGCGSFSDEDDGPLSLDDIIGEYSLVSVDFEPIPYVERAEDVAVYNLLTGSITLTNEDTFNQTDIRDYGIPDGPASIDTVRVSGSYLFEDGQIVFAQAREEGENFGPVYLDVMVKEDSLRYSLNWFPNDLRTYRFAKTGSPEDD